MVVGAAIGDINYITLDFVDNTMAFINATTPIAGKVPLQWLRLADAAVPVAVDVLEDFICPFQKSFVRLESQVVFPSNV